MDRLIERIYVYILQHYDRRECLHNINKNEALSTDSRPINQNSSNIYSCTDEEEAPTDLLYDTDDVYTGVDLDMDMDWRRHESYNQNYTHDFQDTDYAHDDGNAVQDYWDTSASTINENAYGYGSTTTTTMSSSAAKHLPALPALQNGKERGAYDEEGMYARRGNRFGVRLPAPPMDNSRYRMLPQAVTCKSSPHSDLNGHVGSAPHVGPLDERIGSFICLSATATRLLPQPQQHPHPHPHQQRLYGDDNSMESDFRPGISNRDFDVTSCQMDRPFTSMLPLEYTDYSDYGFNSDNLSAYSDTPPMSNTQHKLQQQRKISLMMAMTTASVIASGETRVPIQRNANYPSTQISDRDSIVHFVSEKWSLPPAIPAIPPATTRKLPKRLPSPHYKTPPAYTTTATTLTTTANTVVSVKNLNFISLPSKTLTEKSYRTKQLPKLPIAKSKLNSNRNTISNLDMTSNTISDLSTNETANTNLALMSDMEITQLPPDTNSHTDHHNIESESSVAKTPINVDIANHFQQIAAEEEQTYKNYTSSVDKLHSWATAETSPAPHSSSFVAEYLRTLGSPIEEVKELESRPVKPEKELQVAESSSSFDLSEYLKPYTLDSSKFSTDNKLDYIPVISTQSTTSSITSTKENEPTNLLASLDTHWPYSKDPINIDTDTKSSIVSRDSASVAVVVSTPSNDSFFSVTKMITEPINLISSSTIAEDNKKSVSDQITEPVSSFSNVFTTTNLATCLLTASADNINSITAATPTTTSTDTSITFESTLSLSYIDYMKKFELPELPPIPDISPAVILDMLPDTAVSADTKIDAVSENISNIAYMAKTAEAETVNVHCSGEFNITSYSDIGNITSFSCLPSLDGNLAVEKPLLSYQYIEYANNIENKLSALPLDKDFNRTATVELAERPVSPLSTIVTFDDSFYDSFNVDLSALTATMAHIDTETIITQDKRQNSDCNNIQHVDNTSELNQISILGADNEPERYYKPQPNVSSSIPSSAVIETPLKTTSSSVLGGLSKGLIGGLDGVLGGVGSSSQLVSSGGNSNKKSFSFNLASKLVPSVGGLLSSGNKPPATMAPAAVAATTTSTVKSSFEAEEIASKNTAFGYGYVYEYSPEIVDSTIDYPISHLRDLHTDDASYGVDTFPDLKSTPAHYEYQIDNSLGNDEPVYADDCIMEGLGYEEVFDYADASRNMHLINKTQGTDIGSSVKEPHTVSMESQPPVVAKASGMFGSIFGKAAAAVQSATHAVNQGASSVASAVTQKATSIPGSGSKLINPAPGVVYSSPNKVICGNESSEIYQGTMDNDYNDLAHNEEPLSGPYSVGGDDYENSNTHLSLDYDLDNDNKTYAVYYSDRNHSLSDIVPIIITGEEQQQQLLPAGGSSGKKLPTINGKSGMLIKQQPTEIYDNETRQDDDSAAIIEEDLSGYHIDRKRNDYYINHQQTTTSTSSLGGGAEAYYEHVGTGYDYREDFFNEEDEYKYLEQQRRQQMITQTQSSRDYMDDRHDDDDDVDVEFSDANYPSDEDCGNYLDESSSGSIPVILPKGQGPTSIAAASCSSMTVVAASSADQGDASVSLQLASAHQQIKKQDSIIIEEEDDFHDNDELSPDQVTDETDQLPDLESMQSKTLKKKKILIRGETEEVVGGHMPILRKPEITAKQRWHWAYNKIIIQINVSALIYCNYFKYLYICTYISII